MIDLEDEMTFTERIEGPLGPTTGSPARLSWQIAEATLPALDRGWVAGRRCPCAGRRRGPRPELTARRRRQR
jgi:hypothetical protein